jgi:hypothetical protein
MSCTDRTRVDALIFSAFPGEMEYYHSAILDLRKIEYSPMEYFLGTVSGKSTFKHCGFLGGLPFQNERHPTREYV